MSMPWRAAALTLGQGPAAALTRIATRCCYGRTAAYRRISTSFPRTARIPSRPLETASSSSKKSPILLRLELSTVEKVGARQLRSFHTTPVSTRERQRDDSDQSTGREGPAAAEKATADAADAESSRRRPPEDESSSTGEGEKRQDEQGSKEEQEGAKSKEEDAPPPPHGNKTPWQVFTETLKTEFQASKEWNESTKALASSAHQFTENESVKRARAAYTAASGAATSTTGSALRGTGRALGKGAAWTWETPVVKGVRAGVNMTGRAIEVGTRPVRETEAYKRAVGGVKDVIDDGSSSRYGGWVEKEERRKKRELRELNEMKGSGQPGRGVEKMEEDPK